MSHRSSASPTISRTFAALFALALVACGGPKTSSTKGGGGAGAAEVTRPVTAPDALAMDPAVTVGRLKNGLTYYVRKNAKPEKRAVVWLAVNAGSVLEDDDQRGLAHFLEHMAFNGTKKYQKQEIVNYLEKIGMKFGPDVNAYTSFDETVYQLEVPTDDAAILDKSFDILHEWAQGVALDQEEVDKERGVVLEERRLGRGAQGRLLDKVIPAALPGSKYGQRIPIGTEETLKAAKADTLRRFYKEWYRPDLMAVVAVGDFDPAAVEKQIQERFGDLAAPDQAKPRPTVEVPSHAKPVAMTVSDPELPLTAVGVAAKRPRRRMSSAADYRQALVDRLFTTMLNQRLDELRRKPEAPFLGAGVGKEAIVRPLEAWFQFAVVKGDLSTQALEALTAEVARAGQFGFTATEIDRTKKEILRNYQDGAREVGKTPSRQYAEEMVRNFLTGESMPGIVAELALAEQQLPTITSDEIRAVAGEIAQDQNRVLIAAGNTKSKLPDEAGLMAAAAAGQKKALEAYVDDAAAGPLLDKAPVAGKVTKERTIAEIGVTEWKLSNGVTVVLKPTDFKNDQVLLAGFSPGGHSVAKQADWLSSSAAGAVADVSGAGKVSAVQLGKALAGQTVSVDVDIAELQERVDGAASPTDLGTMMQLVYVKLTAPRRDQEAFAAWKSQTVEALRNQMADPGMQFNRRFVDTANAKHPRRRVLAAEDFEKVDLDRALAFQRARFADLGDFTFILVGNFDVAAVKPLVELYLGGLPSKKRKERWKDVKVKMPRGTVMFEVKKGIEPKAAVRILYHGKAKWSREAEHELQSLAHVLGIRLREELREGMGGTYGVGVHGAFERQPVERFELQIDFGCAPENVDKLVERTMQEIEKLKGEGPSADNVDKVKVSQKRDRELQLKENRFWLYALSTHWWFKTDPTLILKFDQLVDRLDAKVLAARAKATFGKDFVLGVLKPEK